MIALPTPRPIGRQASSLLTSLTSYWKLDETSGTRFDAVTATANDLTAVNTPGSAAGKILNACTFVTASTQRLTHASNSGLQVGNNARTVAYWVKLTDKSANYRLVGKTDGTLAGSEWTSFYGIASDRFIGAWTQLSPNTTISATANNFGSPTAGVYYHVVTWHDPVADIIGISVNAGTADTVSLVGGCTSLATSFDIGAESDGGLPANAAIDEVGWWSRVLTSGERNTLYNSGAGITYPFPGY